MQFDQNDATLARSMRGTAEKALSQVPHMGGMRTVRQFRLTPDNSIVGGMAKKSSYNPEYKTVEFDDYPHTLDLNTDDIVVVRREHTVELSAKNATDRPSTTIDAFRPGCVIRNRYVIESLVGEGGFALVYRALDLHRNATTGGANSVALKVLRPELREYPQAVARLKREFMQTHSLSHPNIVQAFDLDVQDNVWFIVMELLEGESLDARLRRLPGNSLRHAEASGLLTVCADALTFMHKHNITHGDFKPANVFVLHDGGVRIIDLGSSTTSSSCVANSTQETRDCVATPAYASPQVLERTAAVPSDDLFSFACVAFELLSGNHPFAGGSCLEVRACDGALAEPAALSPHQVAILKKGLAWQREDRPGSIREFFHSLIVHGTADTIPTDNTEKPIVLAAANDDVIPAPKNDPAASQEAYPAMAPVSIVLLPELPAVIPTPTRSPISRTPSPNHGANALPAAQIIARAPFVSTAEHEVKKIAPTPVKRKLPFVRASERRVLYALMTCLLIYVVFLQFHRPDAGSSSERIQSVAPNREQLPPITTIAAPTPAETPQAAAIADQSAQLTAPPASSVSFDAENMAVTEHAVAAAIIIQRVKGGSGPLRVRWLIREGSAEAGQDFSGPTSGIAEFADFQKVRALFVPLMNASVRSGDRTFSVELADLSGNVVIAPIRKIHVTIVDTN